MPLNSSGLGAVDYAIRQPPKSFAQPLPRLGKPVALGEGVIFMAREGFRTRVPAGPGQPRARSRLHELDERIDDGGGGVARPNQQRGSSPVEGPIVAEDVRDVVGDLFGKFFFSRSGNASASEASVVLVDP